MKHVLCISIGPVQEFIAAARKARDLWYGSQLLSDISRSVATSLRDSGAELVFPASVDNLRESVPNKIVAVTSDALDPRALSDAARKAGQVYLEGVASEALSRIASDAVEEKAFWAQIRSFLEFYAAWAPIGASGYGDARQQADRRLAGRKALRDFTQPEEAVGRPKSSLDGGRETVLKESALSKLSSLQIKIGEQLDAVSLTKRLANPRQFVSVGRVAADAFIRGACGLPEFGDMCGIAQKLANSGNDSVRRLPVQQFPQYSDFPYDTQLFYGSERGEETDSDSAFASAVRRLNKGDIPAYYAVLVADGDRMGKIISHLSTAEQHRTLSAALVGFARKAETIMAEHFGALLYSGGDDVMAFLPLDTAFPCSDALRRAFKDSVSGASGDLPATLSVGLCIAHYHAHLDSALRWARHAEKVAKQTRNAIAVELHTRSAGEDCVVVSDGWDTEPLGTWQSCIDDLASNRLPDGLPYKLRRLADEFGALPGNDRQNIKDALKAEASRITGRSRSARGTALIGKETQSELLARVEDPDGLRRAVNRLIISRHIVRAQMLAGTGTQVEGISK